MANQHHLELLKQGVDVINKFAAEHPDVTIDLSGADLSGMNLAGLRVQGANLQGANLKNANLQRAFMNATNLRCATLRGADCSGTSFHRADLSNADVRDVAYEPEFQPRLCIHPSSFEGVRWSREQLEDLLTMVNQNRDWEVRWELRPKPQG